MSFDKISSPRSEKAGANQADQRVNLDHLYLVCPGLFEDFSDEMYWRGMVRFVVVVLDFVPFVTVVVGIVEPHYVAYDNSSRSLDEGNEFGQGFGFHSVG